MNNKQRTTTNAHPPSAETSINQKGTITQNKPNLLNTQMNVNKVLTKDYENVLLGKHRGKQTQSNPIQTQSNPKEAGGFEPPSRDVLRQASTCLVALLFFALPNAKRQAPDSAISELILPCRPEQPARPACYLTPFSGPQAKPERTGHLIRQP